MCVGLGFVILVPPARAAEAGALASPMWLIATYLLHTIGELSLSPVGLSAMTRLAPARIAGLVMGVWFLGTSVGNFIGGRVGGLYESMALPTLFGAVGAFAIVVGSDPGRVRQADEPAHRDRVRRQDVTGPAPLDLRAGPPAVRPGIAGGVAAPRRVRGARAATCRSSG